LLELLALAIKPDIMAKENLKTPVSPQEHYEYFAGALGKNLDDLMEERFDKATIIAIAEDHPPQNADLAPTFWISIEHDGLYSAYKFGAAGMRLECLETSLLTEDETTVRTLRKYFKKVLVASSEDRWADKQGTVMVGVTFEPSQGYNVTYKQSPAVRPA